VYTGPHPWRSKWESRASRVFIKESENVCRDQKPDAKADIRAPE
jgi:hypothetical protein